MNKFLSCFFFSLCIYGNSQTISIIPQPASIKTAKGNFIITKKTVIAVTDEADKKTAAFFNDYLQQVYGFTLAVEIEKGSNYIRLITKKFIQAPSSDAYQLTVTKNGVTISGDTYAGTFHGLQTLIQLLPVNNYKETRKKIASLSPNFGLGPANKRLSVSIPLLPVPFVTINDAPRFAYRGMHLDVARHFFPTSFVKKYIDYLALHKLNFFHWHLTDDQGWRIEIKKYPALTSVGGYRNGTIIGRYPGIGNDNKRYGGFYTQEEIKEVVEYATDRHITVIPEIEMPGHASAAIAAYPFLSCFPGQPTIIPSHPSQGGRDAQASGVKKLVQETWGVLEDVFCAGKDSTFNFLQDVLDEVIPLFPSTYIHVGGDESPKTNWKKCPACQKRIKGLGLKDEHELQSYFIQRMEKHLNSKQKTLIGWDEILEGGLAPNAVVMSWRGEQGGIDAAKQNHKVIMTPGSHVYFDHSQSKNEDSLVIGGYTPIEKVYAYEPIPKELDSVQAKFILGAQANLWTEYIPNESKVEYMIFPRMSALSEVLWSKKENKNWGHFENRLQTQFKRYELWKANYSKAYFDLKGIISSTENNAGLYWTVTSKNKGKLTIGTSGKEANAFEIVGSSDTLLKLKINKSGHYRAEQTGKVFETFLDQTFSFHKATGKKVSITKTPNEKYPGQPGAFSLVNGTFSNKGLSYPDWLGWIGDDMEATIDLGKPDSFSTVRIHTLDQNGSWVYLPEYVEVLTSGDGKKYTTAGRSSEFVKDNLTMGWITVSVAPQQTRFIKVVAKNFGMIPEGKPGAGNNAWLFCDEIQVK